MQRSAVDLEEASPTPRKIKQITIQAGRSSVLARVADIVCVSMRFCSHVGKQEIV